LQAHYGSTVDFSNEALQASERGLKRLTKAWELLQEIKTHEDSSEDFLQWFEKCLDALNDDLNTPVAIAQLFEAARLVNLLKENVSNFISVSDLQKFKGQFYLIASEILGIDLGWQGNVGGGIEEELIDLIINLRLEARKNKDFTTSDNIRNALVSLGINLKDTKDSTSWDKI
jgi:cysteinyl-tRNA synthetase